MLKMVVEPTVKGQTAVWRLNLFLALFNGDPSLDQDGARRLARIKLAKSVILQKRVELLFPTNLVSERNPHL